MWSMAGASVLFASCRWASQKVRTRGVEWGSTGGGETSRRLLEGRDRVGPAWCFLALFLSLTIPCLLAGGLPPGFRFLPSGYLRASAPKIYEPNRSVFRQKVSRRRSTRQTLTGATPRQMMTGLPAALGANGYETSGHSLQIPSSTE